MINAPIVSDKLAVRGVYVYRDDAGFIDNVGTGRRDADRVLVRGGRVQALWAPTDRTKVNYLFLNQTLKNDDVGYQEPLTVGRLQKNTVVPEWGEYETTIHNLRVDQEFGFGILTVSAAHHEKRSDNIEDATGDLQSLLPGVTPITISAPSNAELVEDFNPGGGQDIVPAGSTLPGASEWQVSSTLTYEMSHLPLAPSFVLSHRYLSEAPGIFGAGAEQGDFSVIDARVAVRFNQLSLTAFVNNVTDSHGVTTALDDPLQQYLIRPRTVGVTLDYRL